MAPSSFLSMAVAASASLDEDSPMEDLMGDNMMADMDLGGDSEDSGVGVEEEAEELASFWTKEQHKEMQDLQKLMKELAQEALEAQAQVCLHSCQIMWLS